MAKSTHECTRARTHLYRPRQPPGVGGSGRTGTGKVRSVNERQMSSSAATQLPAARVHASGAAPCQHGGFRAYPAAARAPRDTPRRWAAGLAAPPQRTVWSCTRRRRTAGPGRSRSILLSPAKFPKAPYAEPALAPPAAAAPPTRPSAAARRRATASGAAPAPGSLPFRLEAWRVDVCTRRPRVLEAH